MTDEEQRTIHDMTPAEEDANTRVVEPSSAEMLRLAFL